MENMIIKNKRVFTIAFITVLLFLLTVGYLLFYSLVLEDEYTKYSNSFPRDSIKENGERISLTVHIEDFDTNNCTISYCELNNCTNELSVSCEDLDVNEYDEKGVYKVELEFTKYKLYPFNKRYLSNWSIEKEEPVAKEITKDEYLTGLKELLKNQPLREVYSCMLPYKESNSKDWICNKGFFFRNDYLKSISLLYELGNKLNDEELLSYVDDEIEYLNSNKENILNEEFEYPEAYILKLIDIGLSEDYLSIINTFEIPEYTIEVVEDHDFMPLLSTKEEHFSRAYLDILRYADYTSIFGEYGYENLSNYYMSLLIRRYNTSPYVIYSLCTVGYSSKDPQVFEYLKSKLEENISSNSDVLILKSAVELLTCGMYSKEMGEDIEGLELLVQEVLESMTVSNGTSSYIVNARLACEQESEECNHILFNFRLTDNLMYLLYE